MGDRFETRFRAAVEDGALDPAFAARMRALVIEEWQAGHDERSSSDGDDDGAREGEVIVLETEDRTTREDPRAPGRPRRGRWLLVAAAAAVVALVGIGVVAAGDDDQDIDTAGSTASSPGDPSAATPTGPRPVMEVEDFGELEPGTYYIDPDGDDATPLRVTFDVAAEGWSSWIGAAKFDEDGHVALSISTVDGVAEDACRGPRPADPPVGPTVDDLAAALSALSPFEVSSPARDVTLLGHSGTHLQLTVPDMPVTERGGERNFDGCMDGELHSWISPTLGGAFYGYNVEPGRTEDLWILDVDGTRLLLATTSSPASPPQDVAELQAIFDSVRIEP